MRDHKLYLKDILEAMESIETFVSGMDLQTFQADDKTMSAVLRKFEIIGEASKQVPDEIRKSYPKVPWKEMAAMRDKLIHAYFGVDYPLVWKTIKKRIPKVKRHIKEIQEQVQ